MYYVSTNIGLTIISPVWSVLLPMGVGGAQSIIIPHKSHFVIHPRTRLGLEGGGRVNAQNPVWELTKLE